MNLQESAADREFRAEVRSFVERELPHDIRNRVLGFARVPREDYVRWQRILAAKGWGAPGWPQIYGGTGWSASQRVVFDDECYRGGAPRQIPFGLSMVAPVLMTYGSDKQKQHFLPRIISLDDWWCQGYSEPRAGSDLASLNTRAERRGDSYVVNGQKIWTTFAQWANWMFCLARTRADGKPQAGISFLLIDMQTPGIRVRPIRTLDQSSDVCEVFFDEVVVPLENRIGEENGGWSVAKVLLGFERVNIAGVGMCKRLLARLKDYAREQRKHDRPLMQDVRFRDRVVRLEIELMSHEWSLMRLISLEQAGKSVSTEASILKIRGSEIQQQLGALLMESAGPYALPFVSEALDEGYDGATAGGAALNAVAAQYFDLRKVSIYGGTNEIQKNLIGRGVLG